VVIVAVLTSIKKLGVALGKEAGKVFLSKPWVKVFLTVGNVPLGALIGLVPGWLPGDNWCERVLLGVVVGFLSQTIYASLKPLLPGLLETGESTRRTG
jgi:hypothetical protein